MSTESTLDWAAKLGKSIFRNVTASGHNTKPRATNPAGSGHGKAWRGRPQAAGVAVQPAEATNAPNTLPTPAARKAAFPTERPAEVRAPLQLEVKGTVPAWLHGSVVRNGPGFWAPEMQHLFDGYGMLVKFSFQDGKVSVMQRFVESVAYKEYVRTGKMAFSEFGTATPLFKSIFNTLKGVLNWGQGFTDNACVNTYALPDRSFVAMTEAVPGTFKVDVETLNTLRRFEYSPDDGIGGALTTAHPVIDPDGTVYNIYVDFGKGRTLTKLRPNTQRREKLANVPMDDSFSPSWIHDLPATNSYIIVPDTPVVYDTQAMLTCSADYVLFKWDPAKQRTKFHVVPKAGGATRTLEADFDFMAFHYANAFESADGKQLHIDAATFSNPEMVNALKLENMRGLVSSIAPAAFSRITLPLEGGAPKIRTLVPQEQYYSLELPSINPNYKSKEHRYVWGVTAKLPASYGNALSKLDIVGGSSKQWHEPGCIPTEPLMIPRPGATKEDDGVVTSLVSGADGKAFLLVLDAASFEEVARAQLPFGVAYGFHNQFYPAQ